MRWLVDFARKRGEKSMALRLAGELLTLLKVKVLLLRSVKTCNQAPGQQSFRTTA